MDDEFLLYDAGVIPRLQDSSFFIEAIAQFYQLTAATHGCTITISDRRLGEAHDSWLHDVERVLHDSTDEATTELDHFKNAAFIAFWLRRLIPINDVYFIESEREPSHGAARETAPSPAQIRFYRYGNEICALMVGFYVCLAYEVYAMVQRATQSRDARVISDATGVRQLPRQFLSEYPRLLKHKNVSPHSLYMLYRSLFDSLEWQIEGRPAGVA